MNKISWRGHNKFRAKIKRKRRIFMNNCKTCEIQCNVESCCYNENGLKCNKNCISVCSCDGGTCCASYKDRSCCR